MHDSRENGSIGAVAARGIGRRGNAPGRACAAKSQANGAHQRSCRQDLGVDSRSAAAREDPGKCQRWNIILAPEFLMLQTTDYPVFAEFPERWKAVLEAAESLGISVIERLGLRYVDSIQPEPDERVSTYLDPALAGYEPPTGSGLERSDHTASTVLRSAQGRMLVPVSPATTPFPSSNAI